MRTALTATRTRRRRRRVRLNAATRAVGGGSWGCDRLDFAQNGTVRNHRRGRVGSRSTRARRQHLRRRHHGVSGPANAAGLLKRLINGTRRVYCCSPERTPLGTKRTRTFHHDAPRKDIKRRSKRRFALRRPITPDALKLPKGVVRSTTVGRPHSGEAPRDCNFRIRGRFQTAAYRALGPGSRAESAHAARCRREPLASKKRRSTPS